MLVNPYQISEPEAFRGFVEGVQSLQLYMRTNASAQLEEAEEQLNDALAAEPDFAAAQYYKAVALIHARRAEEAAEILKRLNQENVPFKIEVLYNLAFAYAKTYQHPEVTLALETVKEAEELAEEQHKPDLQLMAKALRAWVNAVLGAYPSYRIADEKEREADFQNRQKKYLPEAVELADSVLHDPALKSLPSETSVAAKVEANGAAGGALMYMGRYSGSFPGQKTDDLWKRAESYYDAALRLHSRNVRVLDDKATLYLLRASRAMAQQKPEVAKSFAEKAREIQEESISQHAHDRFRFYQLAQILALIGDWDEAKLKVKRIPLEPGAEGLIVAGEHLMRYIDNHDVNSIVKRNRTNEGVSVP